MVPVHGRANRDWFGNLQYVLDEQKVLATLYASLLLAITVLTWDLIQYCRAETAGIMMNHQLVNDIVIHLVTRM